MKVEPGFVVYLSIIYDRGVKASFCLSVSLLQSMSSRNGVAWVASSSGRNTNDDDETRSLGESTPLLANRDESDGKPGGAWWNPLVCFCRPSRSTAKPERERVWSSALTAVVAVIPTLLVGFTLGYSSAAVLQLQDLSGEHRFSDSLAAAFGVSWDGAALCLQRAKSFIN